MDRLEVDVTLNRGNFRLAVCASFELTGITAVFGASGSGKTSLLRVLAGLEPAAAGRIRLGDQEWLAPGKFLPPESRAIGYVFQDARLFPHLNVLGNLEFPLRHGRRRGRIRIEDTIEALELGGLLSRDTASLSGGEAQRVALARALLADPALLLMDEPLSSLDLPRKRELLPLIRSLSSRFRLPILYVTHDVDELAYLADRMLMLAGGRNIASGSAREILARSDFSRLSELDDPGSILEARIESREGGLTLASLGSETIRLPQLGGEPGTLVRLHIDPRDVILAISEPLGLSIRNKLRARIESIDARADGLLDIRLKLEAQTLAARITRDAAEELGLVPGLAVFALIKSVALDTLGGGRA